MRTEEVIAVVFVFVCYVLMSAASVYFATKIVKYAWFN